MLSLSILGFLVVGVLLGCLVGILPGLGGATTIALLIPFILPLGPQQAIALLIGVAAVTATTGDVTSILFGIPGEATSAATVVDGHPMAQQGEADRAIGAALGSSLVGSIFGGLVLAAFIPLAGPFLRSFGSPELFMAAVLGVSFVVPVSGGSRMKGLIAGGLGLSLAMIGLDPSGAAPRFTAGRLFLWDGIGLIPTALGLFAIPEIVRLGATRAAGSPVPAIEGIRGMFAGLASVVTHWRLVLRCSVIGAGVGLLPRHGSKRVPVGRLRACRTELAPQAAVRFWRRRGGHRTGGCQQRNTWWRAGSHARARCPGQSELGHAAQRADR